MKKLINILCLGLVSILTAQSPINLNVVITPYVTYYLTSIDLSTGSSNIPIFQATLSKSNPNSPDSVQAKIEFEMTIDSEFLGMDNETLVLMDTEPFYFQNDIILSNLDMTIDSREIFDVTGQRIDFRVNILENIDMARADNLFNSVVQTGRLPDGNYSFRVSVMNGDESGEVWEQVEEVISVTSPTFLQLSSPGGVLADTTINEIFTSYPVLQWESDPCNYVDSEGNYGCRYYLRVAEFDPATHSSVDEAIESTTRLPLNQSLGWAFVGNGITSFQYPASDAGELEQGKVYVWQVLKALTTTAGLDGVVSDIMAFKVKDFTETGDGDAGSGSAETTTDPAMLTLQSLIGNDQYQAFFGQGGPAYGYTLTDNITNDGTAVDLSFIQSLLSQGVAETDSVGTVSYLPLNVVSVEVTE
ncbi:MAG: hypothetical protein HQ509_09140 [Candidatus Marinimicrobia bacterium]|nr:hypothetical protein [Candidatus Neomarinimicrobiota bacterium]